jgi:hypothetical protein
MDGTAYMLGIENAQHTNFWDFPLFFNVYQYFGYWGSIDAERLLEIEKTAVLGFFDEYLKGEHGVPLETQFGSFQEADMRVNRH